MGAGRSGHTPGIGLLHGSDAPGRVVQETIRNLYQIRPREEVCRNIGAKLRLLREESEISFRN